MSIKEKSPNKLEFKDELGVDWIVYEHEDKELYDLIKEKGESYIIPFSKIFPPEKEGWDWQKAVERVKQSIHPFCDTSEPKTSPNEFPEDITLLQPQELGYQMSVLESWRSYISAQLTLLEIEYNIIQDSFDIGLGKALVKLESMSEKKKLKEGLIGYAVTFHPTLKKVKTMLIELEARCNAMKRIYERFSNQIATVSREISRRQSEWKYSERVGGLG